MTLSETSGNAKFHIPIICHVAGTMPHSSKHKKGRSEHRGARRVSSKNVISKRTARFKYTVHHSKDVKRKLKKKGVRTISLVASDYHELGRAQHKRSVPATGSSVK